MERMERQLLHDGDIPVRTLPFNKLSRRLIVDCAARYPLPIPSETSVPDWAYADVVSADIFSLAAAEGDTSLFSIILASPVMPLKLSITKGPDSVAPTSTTSMPLTTSATTTVMMTVSEAPTRPGAGTPGPSAGANEGGTSFPIMAIFWVLGVLVVVVTVVVGWWFIRRRNKTTRSKKAELNSVLKRSTMNDEFAPMMIQRDHDAQSLADTQVSIWE